MNIKPVYSTGAGMRMRLPASLFVLICLGITLCQAQEIDSIDFPANIDHLILGVPDLEAGIEQFEEIFGVRPVYGGQHPGRGTHNALLALGPNTYLELIAPDPAQSNLNLGLSFNLDKLTSPKLLSWALNVVNIDDFVDASTRAGLGGIIEMSRVKSDGTVLNWRLTDPAAEPLQGAVPFLIDWGNSTHPTSNLPMGGQLISLRIEHPQPDRLRESLSLLGINVLITEAKVFRMIATIQTATKRIELR